MTEIPEHLLKRSKAAKAKAEGAEPPADAPAAAAGSSAPAKAEAATPAVAAKAAAPAAPAGPPPAKPDIPVVAAAKSRKRIPFWAMATLSLLPLWAFMYVRGLTYKEHKAAGPLGTGAEVFVSSACTGCHGANGEGGVGYAFAGGEVLKTFPHIEDQIRFVYYGTANYQAAAVTIYGNPDREGGAHETGVRGVMPNQGLGTGGTLTDAELLGVVCHERYTLGGADPGGDYAAEYEKWCAENSEIFADLEGGGDIRTLSERFEGIIPIGDAPAAGSPAGS